MNDILITGYKGFIGRGLKGKPFIGRVENYKELVNATEDVIGIVHLASKVNKRVCADNPKACIETNLLGLCNVLDVALSKNLWVIFISTYQIREQHLYGLTKLLGEELCRLYAKKGLKIKIVRLPIVYGPNDIPTKVVTKFINELKNNVVPKIDNNEKLYFAYVDNVIQIINNEMNILKHNIGVPYTLIELVDGIRKVLHEEKK
jgi:nucleoside-diphosphate-sugar epimerase